MVNEEMQGGGKRCRKYPACVVPAVVMVFSPFWLVWRRRNAELDAVGRGVLNFQVTWSLLWLFVLGLVWVDLQGWADLFRGRHSFVYTAGTLYICWIVLTVLNAVMVLVRRRAFTVPLSVRLFR